jgi:hypothetical protein
MTTSSNKVGEICSFCTLGAIAVVGALSLATLLWVAVL